MSYDLMGWGVLSLLICTDFGFADIGSAVVGAGGWSAVASRIGLPIEENRVEQEECR